MYKVEYLRKNFEDRYNKSEKFGKLLGSVIFNLNENYSVKVVERVIKHDGKVVHVDLTPLQIAKMINRNYIEEKITIKIFDKNDKFIRNVVIEETTK